MIKTVIKDKLSNSNGIAYMNMLTGKLQKIWLSSDGRGVIADGLKSTVLEWQIFDAIIKKANSLGGKMFRGDCAHKGKRIGSEDLSIDSIDGFVSLNFYGSSIGKTTLRRSTYYSGILAWAGIVDNCRSNGEGGYIVVKPEFRN